MENEIKESRFDKIEQDNKATDNVTLDSKRELNIQDLSDVAPGDKVKYVRPALHGKEDVIVNFQIMSADQTKAPIKSQSTDAKYYKNTVILTYESENEDGVANKEYISGCQQFVQDDGNLGDLQFWYKGSSTQMATLYERVAKLKGVEPKQLSPKDFVVFMNSKPKVVIAGTEYDNWTKGPTGAFSRVGTVLKNMPGKFL